MNKQPEALRLADAIDPFVRPSAPDHLTSKVAADELRRLHAVNQELLNVLQEIADAKSWAVAVRYKMMANAAIAKAEGEQK